MYLCSFHVIMLVVQGMILQLRAFMEFQARVRTF
uniref:Uncharacterized protein n=1 Tax=Arundo donax TaxID=35708 RepID=A0A0A9HPP3_ARUDO